MTVKVVMLGTSWVLKIKHIFHMEGESQRGKNDYENEGEDFQPRLNIALKNFSFYHKESTSDNIDKKYIPRPKFEHKLESWLTEQSGHGVYLVTGYRGTGKSSLVGAVIRNLKQESGASNHREINKFNFVFKRNPLCLKIKGKQIVKNRQKKYVDVCINIGQENINEVDFLRLLAKTLRDKLAEAVRWGTTRWSWYIIVSEMKRLLMLLGVFCGVFIALLLEFREELTACGYSVYGISFGVFFLFVAIMVACYIGGAIGRVRMMLHLDRLCKNLYAVTRYKSGIEGGFFKGIISKEREVPPVSAQEIEYELINILNIAKKYFSVIIVLDELDKVDKVDEGEEAGKGLGDGEDVLEQSGQYAASQIRRQRVLAMIANMKYFLSMAQAYFVFIAGRELYEAAMADISDREFAIGNLFNGILQIDSFYTRKGLSAAIALTEEFVCRQIDGEAYDLSKLYEKRCVNRDQMVFLYHFICYLAFISHGSPKKIAIFFEKYVRSWEYLMAQQSGDIELENVQWYLSFRDHQQMKINFVHYLAFPILQNIMEHSAIFGDKLRVAESFIFAHIVKLHNSGFSWRNIEQIPEIMAVNREPEVREYIQAILMNMQQGRIKQIVCGLYTYKFPMRMAEEISYFSKLSDELSALLNFSMGELQPIKEHYYALLDKLPTPADRDGKCYAREHVYAEASIRHALGDIYMQEENFSAAIRQFARCAELATPLLIRPTVDDHRQLQNYMLFYYRTMLKLGLAHEKRHTDNSAYMVYGDLWRVLMEVKKNYFKLVEPLFRDNRGLHLGILAQLYVLERMGTTGITCAHIAEAIKRFGALYQFPVQGKRVAVCNPIVRADFYRKLGDILFYKNFECVERGYSAIRAYTKGIRILLRGHGLQGVDLWSRLCDYIGLLHGSTSGGYHGDKIWTHSLAILFESLGHAYVKASRLEDLRSEGGQIAWLFTRIRKMEKDGNVRAPFGSGFDVGDAAYFTQGLYCYWVAAQLYDMTAENQAKIRSYKYLLATLEVYAKVYGNTPNTVSKCDGLEISLEMGKTVMHRMFRSQYGKYEYINMLELDRLAYYLKMQSRERKVTKEEKNMIQSFLSVRADIEEVAYAYSRLLIEYCYLGKACGFIRGVRKDLFRVLLQVVKTDSFTNATLTTLVNRHRLILCIYKYYLFDLLEKHDMSAWGAPADISDTEVKDFIDGGIRKMLDFVFSIGGVENLEKLLELPVQGRPHIHSLRKHRGIRHNSNYYSFAYKRNRFKLLNIILSDAVRRSDEILKWMVGPLQVTTLFNHTFQGNVYNDYAIFLKLYRQLEKYAQDNRISAFDNVFEGKKRAPKYASGDYLAERALQSYVKVQECHEQGQAYQDLIQQLYFLEDDFNNDTIQFYLATERINLPKTKKKEVALRKDGMYNGSAYYLLESYETPMA